MIFFVTLLLLQHGYSQLSKQVWTEDFTGTPVSFVAKPANSWISNPIYYPPASAAVNPKSYLGLVPAQTGDTAFLETPIYNCNQYQYVYLFFSHICKVSTKDIVRIEYRELQGTLMGPWQPVSGGAYRGSSDYHTTGTFNASSYPDWRVNDSTALPNQSWWKDELFDLRNEAGYGVVQFRFVIIHGNTPGTQASYGWLLGDFQLVAATYVPLLPTVELIAPYPHDTITTTAPREIHAKVKTNTDARIEQPWLKYTATYHGSIIQLDSILMVNVDGDSLWKASIPQFGGETEVLYSITGRDTTTNEKTVTEKYYIKIMNGGIVILQEGETRRQHYPLYPENGYARSQSLYTVDELDANAFGLIESIGWRVETAATGDIPVKIWLKTVPVSKTVLDQGDNVDWMLTTTGATMVYEGEFHFATTGWVDIPLTEKFFYNGQENLLVLVEQNCGGNGCVNHSFPYPYFYCKTLPVNRYCSKASNTSPPTGQTSLSLYADRPDFRVTFSQTVDSNSVALVSASIDATKPLPVGVQLPVVATIWNKGSLPLTSATISYSINGDAPVAYSWSGNLSWDAKGTDTIGYYMLEADSYDRIQVWVSMPNGKSDGIRYDDTATFLAYACATGDVTYVVGQGTTIQSIGQALELIKGECGISGDVTFLLTDSLYSENVDLRSISNYLNGHTLTIRSASGKRDSVILRPPSDRIFFFENTHNIIIKDITLDGTATGTHLVDFIGETRNVTFENCVIKAADNTCFQKGGSSVLENLTVKCCLIDGGSRGINIDLSSATTSRSDIRKIFIDSNIFINQKDYGLYFNYAYPSSISYNTITPRSTGQGASWTSIYLEQACDMPGQLNIAGNKVYANNSNINTTLRGMYFKAIDSALVVNNEIYLQTSASTTYGIYLEMPRAATFLHNTLLLAGAASPTNITEFTVFHWETFRGTTYSGTVKNNIFLANSETGNNTYAVFLRVDVSDNQAYYAFDYNTYYTTGNIGYSGGIREHFDDWKNSMTNDIHSVNSYVAFVDSTVNLKPADYTDLNCPVSPLVSHDKEGTLRLVGTTMGCYDGFMRHNNNVELVEVLGVQNGFTIGQTHEATVVIQNTGYDTLRSIELEWLTDGSLQGTVDSTLSLPYGEYDTIPVAISYALGRHVLTVQVKTVNNIPDQETTRDTLHIPYIFCAAPISGTIQIPSGSYPDISTAILDMEHCGISGKVTLLLGDGTFEESLDFTGITATSADTIELVSLSGNATIEASGFGIQLGETDNIYIKNITVNLLGEGYGIVLGSGDNIEINDCRINLDTAIAKNLSNRMTHIGIYRPEGTASHYGRILNSVITGGYIGVAIGAGNNNTHGTHWVFDSNTVQKAYWQNILMTYTDFLSISDNRSFSTATSALENTDEWRGLSVQHCNVGEIQGNKIHTHINFYSPCGMFFEHLNTDVAPAAIYNNEIMLLKRGISAEKYAFVFRYSSGKIYHNSIYVKETSGSLYSIYALLYINTDTMTNISVDVKNNNIIAYGSYSPPITLNSDIATLDYNNYFTRGAVVGNYKGTTANNINAWKSLSGQDANSVAVFPKFSDLSQSMEIVDSFAYVSCPVLPSVATDINNRARQYNFTAMGAYELIIAASPIVRHTLRNFPAEAVNNQYVPIEVEVVNYSSVTIDSILFEYSLNGNTPVSYLYIPASPLGTLVNEQVQIASLRAKADTSVRVWIAKVNNTVNTLADTVSGGFQMKPLVEFVAPRVGNTVISPSFDVYAVLRTSSGATPPPALKIKTTLNRIYTDTFTLPMTLRDGIWHAEVSGLYFGMDVVYSLTVSDTVGNTLSLVDSTYILYDNSRDTVTIGTGTATNTNNPYHAGQYSFSRNYYMSYEMNPDRRGGLITSFAFDNTTTATRNASDVSFYFKAVSDSVITSTDYIDPLADGATLVWGPATVSTNRAGWVIFTLSTPFYLPPNMNLLIYCDRRTSNGNTNTNTYRYTNTGKDMSLSRSGYSFPASGALSTNRPNLRLTMEALFNPYPGNDLAILNMVEPVNSDALCAPDSTPVRIAVTNLGENDYDFSVDSIEVGVEIIDPRGRSTLYSKSITSGVLLSNTTDVIEFITAMPIIYAGDYGIKAWVKSPVDNMPYDDSLSTSYSTGRVALPFVEDFDGILSYELVSTPERGTSKWELYQSNVNSDIQPASGAGMLRYAGTPGAMSKLTTRQIDLYGTENPTLEFWYYHDTALSVLDNSYTAVNIVADGVVYTELTLYKNGNMHGNTHGWRHYLVNLHPYTSNQCVLIEFDAMDKSGGTLQYLDRVVISARQNFAIDTILIPDLSLCRLDNREVQVVIRNTTSQRIDFAQDTAQIRLEVQKGTSVQNFVYDLNSMVLESNEQDTILMTVMNLEAGTYSLTALVSLPIDNVREDDTVRRVFDINPDFKIELEKLSGENTPALAEFEHYQKMTVINTGNMELSSIGLVLSVKSDDNAYTFNARNTFNQTLQPGDTAEFIFNSAYTVPWSRNYEVKVHGYLICDSTILNKDVSVQEYVDMTDLFMVSIEKPADDGTIDAVNTMKEVSIKIKNRNIAKTYNLGEAKVWMLISDTNGFPIDVPVREELPPIGGEQEIAYTFSVKYRVPQWSKYRLNVYIEKIDEYTGNDTLKMIRETDYGVSLANRKGNSFSVEQNIPNPAKENTVISYSIPQDGEITFQLYSISGQVLYTQTQERIAGKHQLELDVAGYASGVYFYTIEYQGQRVTRRMSVR